MINLHHYYFFKLVNLCHRHVIGYPGCHEHKNYGSYAINGPKLLIQNRQSKSSNTVRHFYQHFQQIKGFAKNTNCGTFSNNQNKFKSLVKLCPDKKVQCLQQNKISICSVISANKFIYLKFN